MAAFFLFQKAGRPSDDGLLWMSTTSFERQGFAKPQIVCFQDYVLSLYRRRPEQIPLLRTYPNGDFIGLVGTIVFRGWRDDAALDPIYRNLDGGGQILDDAAGSFVLLAGKGGMLRILTDRTGCSTIFHAPDIAAFSSSFRALSSVATTRPLRLPSVYEFTPDDVDGAGRRMPAPSGQRSCDLLPFDAAVVATEHASGL